MDRYRSKISPGFEEYEEYFVRLIRRILEECGLFRRVVITNSVIAAIIFKIKEEISESRGFSGLSLNRRAISCTYCHLSFRKNKLPRPEELSEHLSFALEPYRYQAEIELQTAKKTLHIRIGGVRHKHPLAPRNTRDGL
jgi:hypothetical protein